MAGDMSSPQAVRIKAILAALALVLLVVVAKFQTVSWTAFAQWVLVIAVVIGLSIIWWSKHQNKSDSESATTQLRILSRSMLSPRCGVALLEAEGKRYLVVHGEGFAEICEASAANRDVAVTPSAEARLKSGESQCELG